MIKYVGDDNPLAPPMVVYVQKWSEKNNWWITPELNGNEFNVSTNKQLIPFDYNTYIKLKLQWELQDAKQKLEIAKTRLTEKCNMKSTIIKVKLTKIKELEDALHPNNIEVGYETIRDVNSKYFEKPKIGERFFVGTFSTSGVQEIIDENTFRTYSSIYKWEILE